MFFRDGVNPFAPVGDVVEHGISFELNGGVARGFSQRLGIQSVQDRPEFVVFLLINRKRFPSRSGSHSTGAATLLQNPIQDMPRRENAAAAKIRNVVNEGVERRFPVLRLRVTQLAAPM